MENSLVTICNEPQLSEVSNAFALRRFFGFYFFPKKKKIEAMYNMLRLTFKLMSLLINKITTEKKDVRMCFS